MQRYLDAVRVRRYSRLGNALSLAGLALMIAGIVLALTRQEEFFLVLAASFSGLTLSQIGMILRNRWGRQPRMDQVLDEALKGFDDRYAIFHYLLGASHALFSPAGAFALCTSDADGEIHYRDGAWVRVRPRPSLLTRSRLQRLPDPASQVNADARRLASTVQRLLRLQEEFPVQPILVFVHPGAQLSVEGAPFPAVHLKKLKPYLRSLPRARALTPGQIAALVPPRLRK